MAERKVRIPIEGDSSKLQAAFKRAGTDADEFRAKVAKLNDLKMDAKVLKIDSNISKVEGEISSLTGSSGKLKGVIGELAQQFLPASAGASTMASSLGGGVAAAGLLAGGVGALGLAMKSSVTAFTNHTAAIAKFSQVTGASVKDASDMVNALDDVGISADTATGLMQKFTQNIDTKKFAEFNIEVAKNTDGTTNMVKSFQNVLVKMDQTKDATQRANIGAAAFGKSWAELSPILDKGAAGFEKSLAANEKLRVSLADVASQKAFKASMDEAGDSLKVLQFQAARMAMPWIITATDDAVKLLTALQAVGSKIGSLPKPPSWMQTALNYTNPIGMAKNALDNLPGGGNDKQGYPYGANFGRQSSGDRAIEQSTVTLSTFQERMMQVRDTLTTFNGAIVNTPGLFDKLTASAKKSTEVIKSASQVLLERMQAEDKAAAAEKSVSDARKTTAADMVAGAQKIKDAEQNVIDVRAKGAGLAKAVVDAEKDIVAARATAREASERVLEIERKIADARAKNTITAPRNADRAGRAIEAAQDAVAQATADVGNTERELMQLRNWGTASADEIARKERDLRSARRNLTEANITLAESQQTYAEKLKELRDPTIATRDLEKELAAAKKTAAEKTDDITTAEGKLADARKTQSELPKLIAIEEGKLATARSEAHQKVMDDIAAEAAAHRQLVEYQLSLQADLAKALNTTPSTADFGDKSSNGFTPKGGAAVYTSSGSRAQNIATIVGVARSKGLSDEQIIGLLANAKGESNFNSGAIGDDGHSVGLFQLHDRGGGTGMSVAQRQNPTLNTQRILSDYGMAKAMAATSAEAFAAAFTRYVERPANIPKDAATRAGFATQLRNDPDVLAALGSSKSTSDNTKSTATATNTIARYAPMSFDEFRRLGSTNSAGMKETTTATKDVSRAIEASGNRQGEAARNGSAAIVDALRDLPNQMTGSILDYATEFFKNLGVSNTNTPAPPDARRPDEDLAAYRKRLEDEKNPPKTGPSMEDQGWYLDGSRYRRWNNEAGGYDYQDRTMMAAGGIVTKRTNITAGEAGPEAIIPLSKMGSLGGGNVNITVQGSVISERELVEAVRRGLVAGQVRGAALVVS